MSELWICIGRLPQHSLTKNVNALPITFMHNWFKYIEYRITGMFMHTVNFEQKLAYSYIP